MKRFLLPILPRLIGAVAAGVTGLVSALAQKHLGVDLTPEQKAAINTGISAAAYAGAHRLVSAAVNPADTASATLAASAKRTRAKLKAAGA